MFAITGITGQVGGVVARQLLAQERDVRAVVRDTKKGAVWAEAGCEVALAAMDDAQALTRAFAGAEGVFILLPPNFDPVAGLSRIAAGYRDVARSSGSRPAAQSGMPVDDRRSGSTDKPAAATADHGAGTRHAVDAGRVFAGRMVHRKLGMGHRTCEHNRHHAELPHAARTLRAHGRNGRYRPGRSTVAGRNVDRASRR